MRVFSYVLGLACMVSAVGCYLPPGTTRVTGGSGQSVEAYSGIGNDAESPTQISVTCDLRILSIEAVEKGEVQYNLAGVINWHDKNRKLQVKASPIWSRVLDGLPVGSGIVLLAEVEYRFGNEKLRKALGIFEFADNPEFTVPGASNKWTDDPSDSFDSPYRHIAALTIAESFDESETQPLIYLGRGAFVHGNFVYHGTKGVILR